MSLVNYQTMLSEKGKPLKIVDGHKFRQHKSLANDLVRWCCTFRLCKSFLKVNKNGEVVDCFLQHNDHQKVEYLERQILSNSLKRRAVDDISTPPAKLIRNELIKPNPPKLQKQDIALIRRNIGNNRLSKMGIGVGQTAGRNSGVSGSILSHRYYNLSDKVRGVTSMAKLSDVVSTLKKMAPLSLAESWDNVGLLIEPDNVQQPIDCVFLTNDLTEDVLDEAENVNANLIVSYHPPVFVPFKRITSDNWKSRIVSRCLGRGIAIYSPHTSWDAVENGLTDWLISCFDGTVSTIKPLNVNPDFSHVATLSSLVTDDKSPLNGKQINSILESHSAFETIKDFKILSHNESQLQVLCNSKVLSSLNEISKSNNIYLHANKNDSLPSSVTGTGRFCQLKNEVSITTVIQKVKKHLGVDNLMVALARGSTLESKIDSAAAVAGSGASVLRGVRAGLYLTGEMSHHDVLDAVHDGVTVVLANHSNTERNYLKVFAGRLLEQMPQLTVHVSKMDRDPLMFV